MLLSRKAHSYYRLEVQCRILLCKWLLLHGRLQLHKKCIAAGAIYLRLINQDPMWEVFKTELARESEFTELHSRVSRVTLPKYQVGKQPQESNAEMR